MASFIFAAFGYILLLAAIAGAFQGELLAATFVLLTSIVLLLKSKSGNKLIAKLAGRDLAPTKSGLAHSVAAFILLAIGGSMLPPEIESGTSKVAITDAESVAESTESIEVLPLPPCIKARLADASALWDKLKQFRHDPEFHQFGFAPGSPFSNWELARKEGSDLYAKCQSGLGASVRYNFPGLAESYSYMNYVGRDWHQTGGKGKPDTQNFIDMIEYALSNDGKAR